MEGARTLAEELTRKAAKRHKLPIWKVEGAEKEPEGQEINKKWQLLFDKVTR